MLVSQIGSGSGVGFRPFVVRPPSCRGVRYHMTERFYGGVRHTGVVLSYLGVMFQHCCKYFITFWRLLVNLVTGHSLFIYVLVRISCNNFEPQEVSRIELSKILNSIRWKNGFFVRIQVHLLMGRVCDAVSFVRMPVMSNIWVILRNGWFTLFPFPSENYPLLVENACSSASLRFCCVLMLWLSRYPSPWYFCDPASVSFFVQRSSAFLFCLTWQSHIFFLGPVTLCTRRTAALGLLCSPNISFSTASIALCLVWRGKGPLLRQCLCLLVLQSASQRHYNTNKSTPRNSK